jgi:hypothetical protein
MTALAACTLMAGCAGGAKPVHGAACPQARVSDVAPASQGGARALAEAIARRVAVSCRAIAPPGAGVHFRDVEYFAVVADPGSPSGFTAFAEDVRDVRVASFSSSAVYQVSGVKVPPFAAVPERARWLAVGRPPLPAADKPGGFAVPGEDFSFTPQGLPLTYRQAMSLPMSAPAMSATLGAHLAPLAHDPPATVRLKQLGFLLADAPLPTASRAAAWSALASVPGLRLCGSAADLAGRRGQAVCAAAQGEEVEVLIDVGRDSVLAVKQYLLKPSRLYPGVPNGAKIGSDTFLPWSPS